MKSDLMHNPAIQSAAASITVGSLLTWIPAVCAIPAAIYYILLLIEKVTGKKISEMLK